MVQSDRTLGPSATSWPSPDPSLAAYVQADRDNTLKVYRIKPELIREHFDTEQAVLSSGYRYRQIFEVIQNAADAILEAAENGEDGGRILVHLTNSHLYVANTGAPLTKNGIVALLGAHSSRKRKTQIGRFGLGFKSLLALGGKIDLFSRSVSIRFDPEACQNTISDELKLPPDEMPAGLRMAEIISFQVEARRDRQLKELGSWATTVLRAEIKEADTEAHLLAELKNFPREFLLFLPVTLSMELELGDGTSRIIHREVNDETVTLHEGDEEEQWLVAQRDVPITDAMRKDAGALHSRKEIHEVPLIWAVPLESAEDSTGKFWAFFPTDTRSRVSGIVNAPWKIDFGRSALVPGEYNNALMRAAAALIVDMIPELSSPDDPGRTLDALPRTLDAKDEPAAPLVQEMWALLVGAAIVPNGTGTLCPAESLSLHPIDDHALAEQWLALVKDEDSLTGVVHPSCLKRQRIPRLKQLRTRSKQQLKQLNTCRWLEAACAATVADCKACLLLVAELNKSQPWQFNGEGIRAAKIVLADTGKLVAAQEAVIDGATDRIRGFYQVEPLLLADGLLRKVLVELLSIKSLDNEEWERRIRRSVANTRGHYGGTELLAWEAVWALLRSAPSAVLEKITNLYDQIKIRCLDNGWRYRHEVLLPGRIVSRDEQEGAAAGLTIAQTHGADAHVFAAMGVSDVPRKVLQAFPGSSAPHGFVKAMRELYWPHLSRRQNPHASLIGIINYFYAPEGWVLLAQASGFVRARISQHFLEASAFNRCQTVEFGHTTQTEKYPQIHFVNPAVWSFLKSGLVEVAGQLVTIEMLGRHRQRLQAIGNHPFAKWQNGIDGLIECIPDDDYSTLPSPPRAKEAHKEELPFWLALSAHCERAEIGVDARRAIYEWMAEEHWYPATVSTEIGNVEHSKCYVTQSSTLAAAAFEAQVPAIVLSPSAGAIWLRNGAQRLESHIEIETATRAEAPVLLIDVIPEFSEILTDDSLYVALVRFVSGLALCVAGKPIKKPCILDAGELLLDREQFEGLSWQGQVELLIGEAISAKWFSGNPAAALDRLLKHSVLRLRQSVAKGHDLADRLLRAVRNNPKQLSDSFDEGTRSAIAMGVSRNGRKLAELALHVHGPAALARLSEVLKENGLKPPSRWGTQDARDFVAALGFPPRVFDQSIAEAPA